MSDVSRIEKIFMAALDKGDPADRASFLDRECGDDDETRQQVERLLRAHPRAGRFLEASPMVDAPPPTERPGAVIGGRYHLLEPIGEGGMGRVWMARQTEPVRRTVALKLIKAGMDTKAVLARFEAERQALALMDHPNIAKVLDAGASDEGRPFFVMELVKGVPITRYCDDRQFTPRQRLELFIPVCQAVQHAHQKGIIHRDLKPSNVLVAQYDDRPVPKVIDFGVAKAAGQPLTDLTIVTGFGIVVGTPEYMSPEQAQFNQLDVDTRSDIYALGVLLYELLTGSTPVNRKELETAGLLEVLRMIREQEPPRPSTRLSTAEGLPLIASNRGIEARLLAGLLRNDLDWIVMKSLEKDRNRRYETATGLAVDIQRHLAGEPVLAHPPSLAYRARKSARKHRVAIITAMAFAGLLIAAAGIATLLALEARNSMIFAIKAAHEADRNANLYRESLGKEVQARQAADLATMGLQIDLDLAEFEVDRRVGLLRLARTAGSIHPPATGDAVVSRSMVQLREFATMASLAEGQFFAPLLRPMPFDEDGFEVQPWRTSPTERRVLTLGVGRSVKLWDMATGRPIALLRRGEEKVITAGFSPDGTTIFTHSCDGVVRLWEAEDGRFRAETEPRRGRLRLNVPTPEDCLDEYELGSWITLLSDDRLITASVTAKSSNDFSKSLDSEGPDELWDSRTGLLIARLAGPGLKQATFDFFGDGRWIKAVGSDKGLLIFSSRDGRPVTRLDREEKSMTRDQYLGTSPSGRTLATVAIREGGAFVHAWDVATLRLTSVTGPIRVINYDGLIGRDGVAVVGIGIADDLFTVDQVEKHSLVYLYGNATPIASTPLATALPDRGIRSEAGLSLLDSGRVFDIKTGDYLRPPQGRKYHPYLARLAPDGRFIEIGPSGSRFDGGLLVDTSTEKSMTFVTDPEYTGWEYRPSNGWKGTISMHDYMNNRGSYLCFLPPSDRLNIPPDLLDLWAKVAVRGELNDEGAFVPWDEPTWEEKRRDLAARPTPIPGYPFPGQVATARLHWLKREYEEAPEDHKPRLARQLLGRAEVAGDEAEAAHWRTILPEAERRK